MISIREVAQLAGVSASTVSRVMNGTAKVDPEKRERVLRVIEETGFVPNVVFPCSFEASSNALSNFASEKFTSFNVNGLFKYAKLRF